MEYSTGGDSYSGYTDPQAVAGDGGRATGTSGAKVKKGAAAAAAVAKKGGSEGRGGGRSGGASGGRGGKVGRKAQGSGGGPDKAQTNIMNFFGKR
jgi:hypothetical protein